MQIFEFIIVLVAIGTIGGLIKARIAAGHRPHPADDPELARSREEVRQLKERVQVLERVITDNHGSNQLDAEIERLRDR